MFEKLHLDELEGESLFEVFHSLFAKIPGWSTLADNLEKCLTVLLIVGVLAALGQCLFGYRLRKIWTAVDGFVVFGIAGGIIARQAGLTLGAAVGIGIAAAVAGALLGFFLWMVGCFFRVFLFTVIMVFAVCVTLNLPVLGLIIGLAAGLIAVILYLTFYKPFFIVYTSIAGGFTAALLFGELIPALAEQWYVTLLLGGAISAIGFMEQLIVNRKSECQPAAVGNNIAGDSIDEDSAEREDAKTTAADGAAEAVTENQEADSQPAAAEAVSCPECGAGCIPGAKYCIKCGHKLI